MPGRGVYQTGDAAGVTGDTYAPLQTYCNLKHHVGIYAIYIICELRLRYAYIYICIMFRYHIQWVPKKRKPGHRPNHLSGVPLFGLVSESRCRCNEDSRWLPMTPLGKMKSECFTHFPRAKRFQDVEIDFQVSWACWAIASGSVQKVALSGVSPDQHLWFWLHERARARAPD